MNSIIFRLQDIEKLLHSLPNAEVHLIPDRIFGHHDFVVGSTARKHVYDKVVDLFNHEQEKSSSGVYL